MWIYSRLFKMTQLLGDGPMAIPGEPDTSRLSAVYRQAQTTANTVTAYFQQQSTTTDTVPDLQERAIQDLVALSEQSGLQSSEVATVRDILTKMRSGQSLTADDVQALTRVVSSLQARLGETGETTTPATPPVDPARVNTNADRIIELASGYTSGAEEQEIMGILRQASQNPAEMRALLEKLAEKGLSYNDLFGELGDDEAEFLRLTASALGPEQKAQAIADFASGYTSTSDETAISALLAGETSHEGRAALLAALNQKGVDFNRLQDELEDQGQRLQFQSSFMRPEDYTALRSQNIPLTDAGIQQAFTTAMQTLRNGLTNPADKAEMDNLLNNLQNDGRLDARAMAQLLLLQNPTATPLHPSVDRQTLTMETLRDLENPTRINQGEWGTCAATRVQTALALRDPSRYVEILRSLSSPEGDASALVPGLQRPADQDLSQPDRLPQREDQAVVGTGSRTLTTRLMSPAFMNQASGGFYLNTTDQHDFPWYRLFDSDHSGLNADESGRLLGGVLGVNMDTVTGRDAVWERLQQIPTGQQLIPVGMRWDNSGHAVLFAGTSRDPATNQEVALLINPWGQRHTMPLNEFRERLTSGFFPPDNRTPVIPMPDRGTDPLTYRSLQNSQYMNSEQVLNALPAFTGRTADQQRQLREFVADTRVGPQFVEFDLNRLLGPGLDNSTLARLRSVADRHRAAGQYQVETRMREQIYNKQGFDNRPSLQGLATPLRERLLNLLAAKDVPHDPALLGNLARLATAGQLTDTLLTQLEGQANAAQISQAVQAAVAALTPASPTPVPSGS